MSERILYLDTETTGLRPEAGATIVEIALIDDAGDSVIDTLIDPEGPIPADAARIHGITDDMVAGKPTMRELWPEIQSLTDGAHIVIYNAGYDTRFFPGRLANAARISCAMLRFAEAYGDWNDYRKNYRWQKLDDAARHIGFDLGKDAHRAAADARAARAVWHWLEQNHPKTKAAGENW